MKKNKGFTLIELLAVIVILAVIALIAAPLIMNIISEAKKGAFLDSSYAIVTAAEQGYAKSLIKEIDAEETEYTFDNGVKALKNGNISLEYKGSNPNYGNLIINDEGNVSINFYSNGWCATKGYDADTITIRAVDAKEDCVPDVVAPVITLETSDIMLTTNDTSYIEPGYSVVDDTDGDITSNVIITNNINYGEVGEYYITYTISDSAGNSTVVTRKVIVELYEPTLKVEAYNSYSYKPFLYGPIKKQQIESINFSTTNIVPSGVLNSWDVSEKGDGSVMAWYKDANSDGLYEVTIGGDGKVYANSDSSYLFMKLDALQTIDFTNFDTSNVINMTGMFNYTIKLVSLDLSSFNTSNVTNMSSMFSNMTSLTSIDLSSFNTSNVTQMAYMFMGSSSLTTINLSSFITSNTTYMAQMFSNTNVSIIDFRQATFDLATGTGGDLIFYRMASGATIYTKNATTKSWLESKLQYNGITGTVIIAS
ncbi:MAG: BspA family leucine-rich repeat surface protein [Bacilli bacterium]|nr:BspA family leucine-rich repeat surface protein [Bacilli bacterium]